MKIKIIIITTFLKRLGEIGPKDAKNKKEMLTLGVEPRISSLLVMRFTTKPCELLENYPPSSDS